MAFDAGMMAFSVKEMSASLVGGKVEKIYQPSRDEIIILVKNGPTRRLKISAGASPMIGMTEKKTENPEKAPMFCMLLRKHLSGGRVSGVSQLGFERCMQISFDSYDELGFPTEKHIIAEVMGKYSNIILTDGEGKEIAALKPVELSDKQLRPILPGMRYELPPTQAKSDSDIILYRLCGCPCRVFGHNSCVARGLRGFSRHIIIQRRRVCLPCGAEPPDCGCW